MKPLALSTIIGLSLFSELAYSGTCIYKTPEFRAQVLKLARAEAAAISSCSIGEEVEGGVEFSCKIDSPNLPARFYSGLALVTVPSGSGSHRNCRISDFRISQERP